MVKRFVIGKDLGGTKTDIVACEEDDAGKVVIINYDGHPVVMTVATKDFDSADDVVRHFLAKQEEALRGRPLAGIGYGYAGFLRNGSGRGLNMPFEVDREWMEATFSVPVVGENDIPVLVRGLSNLAESDFVPLSAPATFETKGPLKTLIAGGTGTGGCLVNHIVQTDGSNLYLPLRATEWGHLDWPPASYRIEGGQDAARLEREWRYFIFLRSHLMRPPDITRATLENALNLWNVYQFLRQDMGVEEHPEMAAAETSNDPAAKVCELAKAEEPCPICKAALELYCQIYGRAGQTIVLAHGAFDGLLIDGGAARKIGADHFRVPFMRALLKGVGHHQERMEALPVWLVNKPASGAWGAASAAFARVNELAA